MRRGWLLAVLLVMGVACLGQERLEGSRDSLARMNRLRVDLLVPLMVFGYLGNDNFPWRTQIEYQRSLMRDLPLSITIGAEYSEMHELFYQLWQFVPDFHLSGSWRGWGRIRTRRMSGYLGLQLQWWIEGTNRKFGVFVSPALGLSRGWGRKMSLLVNGSCCDYDVKEVNLIPRLRTGHRFILGKHIGLDAAIDGIYMRLLGAEKRRLFLVPLVNLDWRF